MLYCSMVYYIVLHYIYIYIYILVCYSITLYYIKDAPHVPHVYAVDTPHAGPGLDVCVYIHVYIYIYIYIYIHT